MAENKPDNTPDTEIAPSGKDFIRTIIDEDIEAGRFEGQVVTRLPPEPNGFLHIGHAKAFLLSSGVADEFGGRCNLRFDDTNPLKEETAFVEAIKTDLRWLGIDWKENEYFASDYYGALHDMAVTLIRNGKAYVDDLSAEETRKHRGTLTEPGTNSPFRNRSIEENLELFGKMRAGDYEDGARVLRAKIDMASPNMNMRDPVMYRIMHAHHHRTGDDWCIYPTYDWAHGQSDSIEGITHSLCDLAFEDHRPLYDWFLDELGIHHPRQIEFARLNLTYTVLSKRKLRRLVEEGHVSGWDDPRMPTLSGLRRRGYTPEILRAFIKRIGMSKTHSMVDIALLEFITREELNKSAPRVMAVLDPILVIVDNYPADSSEQLEAENNPEDPDSGTRTLTFGRELYIEREDFKEDPPRKYFRLSPGKEVRLKHAYYITCTDVVKDDTGKISEIHCTYDPATKGGSSEDGRKIKGTLHWVTAAEAVDARVCLFDRLFTSENVEEQENFLDHLNADSLTILDHCKLEPALKDSITGDRMQFLRQGYYSRDTENTGDGRPVFNRIVGLRDSWAKIERQTGGKTKA
ncbi:MAG: glutamine--tRNA ligase/YqeY domain fusion protein [Spirochaetales bacterium]|jgi:glutaminyl-tRNA synthetase|nr:glutamine--tRNA ligase/YqeY domain fusion protein [Spirochaetales bacterium]